jgi:hypothetical protein
MGLKQKGDKFVELLMISESRLTGEITQATMFGGMENFIFDNKCGRCDDCDTLSKNCHKCKYESDYFMGAGSRYGGTCLDCYNNYKILPVSCKNVLFEMRLQDWNQQSGKNKDLLKNKMFISEKHLRYGIEFLDLTGTAEEFI